MIVDYHIHSKYSPDSELEIDSICKQAIKMGVSEIVIADHTDLDNPYDHLQFWFDEKVRLQEIQQYREKYKDLHILNGVEIGITANSRKEVSQYIQQNDFDFVISSVHLVNGVDPWFKEDFFVDKEVDQSYERYLKVIYDCLFDYDDYDIIGHIGYPARYCDSKKGPIKYDAHRDILDAILKRVIDQGKGIEVNTKGIDSTGDYLPEKGIIERYKQLGGQIITVGSDAHIKEQVGQYLAEAYEFLKSLGFEYYTRFEKRKPVFTKIL